ncbi:MAG TPA: class I SAM-dependent methyltransferase [Candidatus Limnocylindrales bacterium]|jgi:SAM-dependent methyltransferase|nr:class I SAM-dependent methyltransferase [Candidatus Limnocylindrales bacterium]
MPFLESVEAKLRSVETEKAIDSFEQALKVLRTLGIDDFGFVFMSMPNPQFPKLSRLLPRMAAETVQLSWTGSSGVTLLRQTCSFVRALTYNYAKWTLKPLDGASILDFGCGYGRIARLMYYFTDPSRLVGVDPWDRSIAICREDRLAGEFAQSSYLPTSLPVGDRKFDLIYAFSVFTHLSERATNMCLSVLAKYLQPDGLLVITIRPIEYWHHHAAVEKIDSVQREISLHREKGFAFLPHNRTAVDGDITYGDTSLTLEWLSQKAPFFSVRGVDRSLDDPLQQYVFLQHASAKKLAEV